MFSTCFSDTTENSFKIFSEMKDREDNSCVSNAAYHNGLKIHGKNIRNRENGFDTFLLRRVLIREVSIKEVMRQ